MNNKTKLLIVAPLLFIILASLSAYYIPLNQSLSETDQQILDFKFTDIQMPLKKVMHAGTYRTGPIRFPPKPVKEDEESDANLTSSISRDNDISLIIVGNRNQLAIIGGNIVKEGDKIADKKIAKIEPDRVLLKDKTSAQWLYIGD